MARAQGRGAMRAAIIDASGRILVGDRPHPVVADPADAVVRVVLSCACGGDLWFYRGESPFEPGPIGREFVGVVEDVGISGVGIAAEDGAGDAKGAIGARGHQLFEGRRIAPRGASNELRLGRRRQCPGAGGQGLHVRVHAPFVADHADRGGANDAEKTSTVGSLFARPRVECTAASSSTLFHPDV